MFETTDIKYLIDYKWRKSYKQYLTMGIFAVYIYVLIEAGMSHNPSNKQQISIFNSIMLLSEIYQIITLGNQYFK